MYCSFISRVWYYYKRDSSMKMRSVIGDPIAHSLSDVLHKELYGQLDIQAKYSKKHILLSEFKSTSFSSCLRCIPVRVLPFFWRKCAAWIHEQSFPLPADKTKSANDFDRFTTVFHSSPSVKIKLFRFLWRSLIHGKI